MTAARSQTLRVALAQINPTVGDVSANGQLVADAISGAREAGAGLVVFPELVLSGMPPGDLLLRRKFLSDIRTALKQLASQVHGITALIGYPELVGSELYNAAAVLADGAVQRSVRKRMLRCDGAIDEPRYFVPGDAGSSTSLEIDGLRIGVAIGELDNPSEAVALTVLLGASPYYITGASLRESAIAARARESACTFCYCGLVGGQDELVFEGRSFVVGADGGFIARAGAFSEQLLLADIPPVGVAAAAPNLGGQASETAIAAQRTVYEPPPEEEEEVYYALLLGLRDYVNKNGFDHVVLGLSGGIDSALVALLAVDALGADAVSCVAMPSPYSSAATKNDAAALARSLGTDFLELPIDGAMWLYEQLLAELFARRAPDLTEENLQARIRGNLLMALSNKFGWLVLTTGNRSEIAVGYSTLYGDSAGGFAPIKDVPKTLVFRLCAWRNSRDDLGGPAGVLPSGLLTRPPSAELRPDQRDDDSLPPYELLDPIIAGYVEQNLGVHELVQAGHSRAIVEHIIHLIDLAEYKRRQQPPGIKITSNAFGTDRRMPITNRYRER